MKKISLMVLLLGFSSLGYADYPNPKEMRSNFRACSQDPHWYHDWGQYCVSFDLNEARELCRSSQNENPSSGPKAMGCEKDGHFVSAGFYCDNSYGKSANLK